MIYIYCLDTLAYRYICVSKFIKIFHKPSDVIRYSLGSSLWRRRFCSPFNIQIKLEICITVWSGFGLGVFFSVPNRHFSISLPLAATHSIILADIKH